MQTSSVPFKTTHILTYFQLVNQHRLIMNKLKIKIKKQSYTIIYRNFLKSPFTKSISFLTKTTVVPKKLRFFGVHTSHLQIHFNLINLRCHRKLFCSFWVQNGLWGIFVDKSGKLKIYKFFKGQTKVEIIIPCCPWVFRENGPTGAEVRANLATTSRDESEANWNGQTAGQDADMTKTPA